MSEVSLGLEDIQIDGGQFGIELPGVAEAERGVKAFESICQRLEGYARKVEAGEFTEVSVEFAKIRIALVEGYWKALLDAHVGVYSQDRGVDLDEALGKAEDNFTVVIAALRERVGSSKAEEPKGATDITNTWGEFDGDLKKWPAFKDRFVAAVHSNAIIPLVYKFQHLVKSVKGRAAQALGEWRHTEGNYALAWERLCHLYDKKYRACHELLNELMRLPCLRGRASAAELQRMANVTHETLRQLGAQGVPVEHWDVMIIFLLHSRLDEVTSNAWELHRVGCVVPEVPTVTEMVNFLELQAAALQRPVWERVSSARENDQSLERGDVERGCERERHREKNGRSSGDRQEESKRGIELRKSCSCCDSLQHSIWDCPEFEALSMSSKQCVILDKGLCNNCLKVGHHSDRCYQGPCRRCPGRQMHNSLLCSRKGVISAARQTMRTGE